MSAVKPKFVDIPADEWEAQYFADELKQDRKADKPARWKASNFAAAFDALCDVAGFSPEARLPLHVFLSMTKGKAPDEELMICETDAGRFLPGDEGVTVGSLRKRWVRAWNEILVPEMARTGRVIGRRVKGSITLATRHSKEKKEAPVYFSEIAQAVVDIEREAGRMRGLKRDERMRRAAIAVFNNLPKYVAPTTKPKITAAPEPRDPDRAGGQTRRMKRFDSAAQEMIEAEKANGDTSVETLAARLAVRLANMAAEATGLDRESMLRLMADALTHEAASPPEDSSLDNTEWTDAGSVSKSDDTPAKMDCENAEENRTFDPSSVDGAVHATGVCVSCGAELTGGSSDACKGCGPPERPSGATVYAEEFLA